MQTLRNGDDRLSIQPVEGRSVFPQGSNAYIYRPSRSAMTSGKARTKRWVLAFEPGKKPFIEPLMGWTGSSEPLDQVELTFPTCAAAVVYAERQGLPYTITARSDTISTSRAGCGDCGS
jgi:hypothetical protein